jgi:ribonuclease HII
MDWLYYERELWQAGFSRVAGVDEAGRGPLAGPVVAAAVIFAPDAAPITGINDSKKLSAAQREELYPRILASAFSIGIGLASHEEIDNINILQASYLAMQRAVALLMPQADHLLVDGRGLPKSGLPGRALVGGDSLSMSIAAASIIAKVTRDGIMMSYDALHPEYGFADHKGYPTRRHIEAIKRHGVCPIHRRSFHPKALNGWEYAAKVGGW